MMRKHRIKLIENGVEIDGVRYYDGMEVKIRDSAVNHNSKKSDVNGVVKFKVYEDGECYIDEYHIGWVVEYESDGKRMERTLIDAIESGIIKNN